MADQIAGIENLANILFQVEFPLERLLMYKLEIVSNSACTSKFMGILWRAPNFAEL